MHQSRKRCVGYTLTESAIVLGIVGIIMAGIWVAAANVNETNALRNASESIVKIAQGVRLLYTEQSQFKNASLDITDMLKRAKVFPADILDSSGDPVTPWGTGLSIVTSANKTAFELRLAAGLPTKACYQLAMMMIGPGREPTLVGIQVNAGALITDLSNTELSDLGNACSQLSFTFKLK